MSCQGLYLRVNLRGNTSQLRAFDVQIGANVGRDMDVDEPDVYITLDTDRDGELDDVVQRVEVDEGIPRGIQIRRHWTDTEADVDHGTGHGDFGSDGKVRLADHLDVVPYDEGDANPVGHGVEGRRSVSPVVAAQGEDEVTGVGVALWTSQLP